jgi:hypothetical protein
MKPSTHQLFARLCESFTELDEASSSIALVQNKPGAKQVIQQLHKTAGLSHNQEYKQIDKISWSDLKERYPGGWVIISGPKGTGAIKAKNKSYTALASAGGEVSELQNDKGGNILDFLQGVLGGRWANYTYYIGTENKYASGKKNDRRQMAPAEKSMSQEQLMNKFRPLWSRATTAAIADVKGMVATMIKNDAFEKAERKLGQLKYLERVQDAIESGNKEMPDAIKVAMSSAVGMAAYHYYPEETGNITKSRYGSSTYSTERSEGPAKLLQDISNGDQKKLGTVLSFFKRSLIST